MSVFGAVEGVDCMHRLFLGGVAKISSCCDELEELVVEGKGGISATEALAGCSIPADPVALAECSIPD
jgi:hypothetical protein